ncbi:MAG: adenylate kinase [Bacillota bacterium]
MRLIFLGPPGAGKGTQAEILAEKTGLPRIATGDIFRRALKEGTPLGLEAKAYMDKGELVPDGIVTGIVRERILLPDCRYGFILDGFPRTLPQAESLDELLGAEGMQIDAVIYMDVADEELVARAAGRRVCRSCQMPYHIRFSPPAVEGVCDACGGTLYQRDDDREETVQNRLNVYKSQTAPLVDYYAQKGILRRIDGSQPIDRVSLHILKVVGIAE